MSASHDKTLNVWDAATGAKISVLEGHSEAVYGVSFSPDGGKMTTGGADRSVLVWDARSGEQVIRDDKRVIGRQWIVLSALSREDFGC